MFPPPPKKKLRHSGLKGSVFLKERLSGGDCLIAIPEIRSGRSVEVVQPSYKVLQFSVANSL